MWKTYTTITTIAHSSLMLQHTKSHYIYKSLNCPFKVQWQHLTWATATCVCCCCWVSCCWSSWSWWCTDRGVLAGTWLPDGSSNLGEASRMLGSSEGWRKRERTLVLSRSVIILHVHLRKRCLRIRNSMKCAEKVENALKTDNRELAKAFNKEQNNKTSQFRSH